MKRLVLVLCLFALAIGFAHAQTSHSVQLKWTASGDSTAANPGAVTVYRAAGTCPASASGIGALSYTALTTSAAAAGPYADTTVTPGTYCYYITFSVGGATSPASNTAQAVILPLAPAALTVAISQ